jgi:hypothetical protein
MDMMGLYMVCRRHCAARRPPDVADFTLELTQRVQPHATILKIMA